MSTAGELGNGQSPIDISDWLASDDATPQFHYLSDALRVERLQGLPMIHFERGSEVRVGDQAYRLLQVHWHTPAEHFLDGQDFAAEVHLVHIGAEDRLLVVGAIYELGEPDAIVRRIIDETIRAESDGSAPALNASELVPPADAFTHYVGSLTAPPFSEPVLWYLSRTIATVSERQVEQLQALTNGPNARPLQDRNGRTILCCR